MNHGDDYYRMVDVYFDYRILLRKSGRDSEALSALKKASLICNKNYGEKAYVCLLSYKLIGDHYMLSKQDMILLFYYYQKSLIAVVN